MTTSPQDKHPRAIEEEGLQDWFLDVEDGPGWDKLHQHSRRTLWSMFGWSALFLAGLVLWNWWTAPVPAGLQLEAMVGVGAEDWERLSRPSPRYEDLLTQGWAATISEQANYSGEAQPLPPPRPGTWLYEHPEPGQTWSQFKQTANNRRTELRHTIYVAPLGPMSPEGQRMMRVMAEYLDAYYDTRTRILPSVPLPIRAWNKGRKQYNARTVLDRMRMYVPEDALGLLTLTEADLFIPSTDHVFGLGSFDHKVATVSMHRFGRDFKLSGQKSAVLRRTLTTASHEFGHALGMRHCTAFRCLMNGTNSLHEADEHPLHLCPECQRKAEHAMGFHRQDRYARLLDFYERYDFTREVDFVERRLDPPVIEFLPSP